MNCVLGVRKRFVSSQLTIGGCAGIVLCEEDDSEEIPGCFFGDLFHIDSSNVWDSVESSSDASWDPIIEKLMKHEVGAGPVALLHLPDIYGHWPNNTVKCVFVYL